jgi:hypothetical protein
VKSEKRKKNILCNLDVKRFVSHVDLDRAFHVVLRQVVGESPLDATDDRIPQNEIPEQDIQNRDLVINLKGLFYLKSRLFL